MNTTPSISLNLGSAIVMIGYVWEPAVSRDRMSKSSDPYRERKTPDNI
jgi:hypothetical protein